MHLFNLDLHVAVIADVRSILARLRKGELCGLQT
jgi:hypothetical protein